MNKRKSTKDKQRSTKHKQKTSQKSLIELTEHFYIADILFNLFRGWMYVIIGSHFVQLESIFFTYSIIYCKMNVIVCQIPLINGVSIVQKLATKLPNMSTTFSQAVDITLSKCIRVWQQVLNVRSSPVVLVLNIAVILLAGR